MARETGSRVGPDPDAPVDPGEGAIPHPSGREEDPSVGRETDAGGDRRRRQRDRDRDGEDGNDDGGGPVDSRASPDEEDIDVDEKSTTTSKSKSKSSSSRGLGDRFRGAISRAADRARGTTSAVGNRVDQFADRAGRTIDKAGDTVSRGGQAIETVVDTAEEVTDTAERALEETGDESVEEGDRAALRELFDTSDEPDTSAASRDTEASTREPSLEDLAGGGQGATEAVEDVAGDLPGSETAGKIAAAGAPLAAAEPTPIGETGLAVITGGTIAGATALEAAERTRVDEELARLIGGGVTEQELPLADPTAGRSELPARKEPANEQPELFPSGEPVQEGSELDPRRAIDDIVEVPVPAEGEGDAGLRAGEQVGKVIGEQRRERSRSRQRREDSLLDRINDELERFERRKREERRGRQRRERERERRRERSQEQRERRQERTDERAQRRRERAQETLEERRQRRRERARENEAERILRELPTGGEAVVDEGVPGSAEEADPETMIESITEGVSATEVDQGAATESVGGDTVLEPLVGDVEDEDEATAPVIDTEAATEPAVDEQLDQIAGTRPAAETAPDTAVETVVDQPGLQRRETIPLFGTQEPTAAEPAEAFPEEVADPTETATEYGYPTGEETVTENPPGDGSGGDDGGQPFRFPELGGDELEEELLEEETDTRVFPTAIGSGEQVLDALFSEESEDKEGDNPPLF